MRMHRILYLLIISFLIFAFSVDTTANEIKTYVMCVGISKYKSRKVSNLKKSYGSNLVIKGIDLEIFSGEVFAQEKTNESLTMKVNELTSFENVKKVVEEMGLAYNNENIIVVDK